MGSIKFFKKDFRCFGGFSHAFHRYSKADLEVKRGFYRFYTVDGQNPALPIIRNIP